MGKFSYNDKLRVQTLCKYLVRKPSFPITLTKSAVESTALAQPFCVNQAVADLFTIIGH